MNKSKQLIKLRQAPIMPERMRYSRSLYDPIRYCKDLSEVWAAVHKLGIHPTNIYRLNFHAAFASVGELGYYTYEVDADYDVRMAAYQAQLDEYNAWYNEHKELIEQELERRKVRDQERSQARKKKKLADVQREIDRLNAKLATLET